MLRNVSGQKWRVYAWDTTTGQAKTGDASNISAYITLDDGTPAATNDTAPTEVSSTNEPGYYDFTLLQAETNGAKVSLSPKSSTSDIAVIACPPVVYTVPQYFSLLGIEIDGDLTKVNTLEGHTAQTGNSYPLVAALNDLSSSDVQTAVNAALTSFDAATATDVSGSTSTISAAIAALNDLDAAGVRTAIGLATANLDTQLSAIDSDTGAILTDTGTTIPGLIAALNDLDSSAVQSATAAALTAYDGPTDTEMDTAIASVLSAISGLNDIDAAGIRTAVGMAAADLDDQIDTLSTFDPTTDEVESGITWLEAERAKSAVLCGQIADAGTGTETFKAINNSGTSRVVVTVDGSGNRSAFTLTL